MELKKGSKFQLHLCLMCKHEFACCEGNPEFGEGIGNDNVISCDFYEADDDDEN